MADALALLLACATGLWPLGAGAQGLDYSARQRLESAVMQLADPLAAATQAQGAQAIMAGLGLGWAQAPQAPPPARATVPNDRAVIELVDIRLLLAQIAIQAGAQDHLVLTRAQGAREHDVILLRGGIATLADLPRLAAGTPAQDVVTITADGILLTRPLAIWADAGLALGPADHLILDRASGSFVANLGQLALQGGTISGTTAPNPAEPAFRPFVLTAGQGGLTARGASFRGLGFGDAAAFGGIAVVNTGLVAPPFPSVIADSTLIDVTTLALIGTTGAVVAGNRLAGSGGTAILIAQGSGSLLADNRLTALHGGQGIRVTRGATGVTITGNHLSGHARIGILIDRDSRDITIAGNLVAGALSSGIAAREADCIAITGNLLGANGGTGIGLTASDGITLQANAILFNAGSGILLRDQTDAAQVRITGNVLIGNRDGLRGATPGRATITGNDLDGQMPRVFAGDLAPLTVDWLRHGHDLPAGAAPLPCPMPEAP